MTSLRTEGVVIAEPPAEARRIDGVEVSRVEPLAAPPPMVGRSGAGAPIGSLTDRLFLFVRPDVESIALLRADRQAALLASLLEAADDAVSADGQAILQDISVDLDELIRQRSALVEG